MELTEVDTANEGLCSARCIVNLPPIYKIVWLEETGDSLQRTECILRKTSILNCLVSHPEDLSERHQSIRKAPVHRRSLDDSYKSRPIKQLCEILVQSVIGGNRDCSIAAVFSINARPKQGMRVQGFSWTGATIAVVPKAKRICPFDSAHCCKGCSVDV